MKLFDYNKIKTGIGKLEEEIVIEEINKMLAEGADAQKIMESCQDGMTAVGKQFQTGEYYIGDLIFAGEIMKQALDILKPYLITSSSETVGKMVLCTVQGDLHDIGKNIVRLLLESSGFDVIDLGIDVSAQRIADTIRENKIKILALSGVLTLAIESMRKTVELLKQESLRNELKIIVGGSCISDDSCKIIGADAWTYNPQDGVAICRKWAMMP